jgi:hypothetical protein
MNVLVLENRGPSRNLFLNEADLFFSGAGTRLLTKRLLHSGAPLHSTPIEGSDAT